MKRKKLLKLRLPRPTAQRLPKQIVTKVHQKKPLRKKSPTRKNLRMRRRRKRRPNPQSQPVKSAKKLLLPPQIHPSNAQKPTLEDQ